MVLPLPLLELLHLLFVPMVFLLLIPLSRGPDQAVGVQLEGQVLVKEHIPLLAAVIHLPLLQLQVLLLQLGIHLLQPVLFLLDLSEQPTESVSE